MGNSLEGSRRSDSRGLIWLGVITLAGLVLTVMFAAAGTDADAKESYHDPAADDVGYCSSCHPGFTGGRNDSLHRLHTSGDSALGVITRNCDLCHTGSGRDNPLTMWSTGDADDGLGCAGCHGRNYGETIHGNYGGFPIAGSPKATAYGLRAHHLVAAGIGCGRGCHSAAPTGILAENVAPPYYLRADVNVSDPCADFLDNDGDGMYDLDDPDCTDNRPPVADPGGPYEGIAGVAVSFDGSASYDSDGSIVLYDWDFGDGTTGTGPTPSHVYETTGVRIVSLTVADDDELTDTATTTATITVSSGTDIVAGDDSYATPQDVMLTVPAPGVLGNDSHAAGAPLTAVLNGDAAHGTLDLQPDGSFTYLPADGFVGSDSFTYVASDGVEQSNVATVAITVTFSEVVQAVDDTYTTPVDTTLAVAAPGVLGNDFGGPGLWAFKRSNPSGGSVVLLSDGSFTYTPQAGFVGSDSFTYDFWDGTNQEWSNIATVNIEVAHVDLDIDRFRATKRAVLSRFDGITLTLRVVNNGSVAVPAGSFGASATIVGLQEGTEVYRESLPIGYLEPGTTAAFEVEIADPGAFSPGQVHWTASLRVPGDSDDDQATAITKLVD